MGTKKSSKTSNAAVIRIHKNKNYTVMSNKHLFQRDLSLKAKGLMSLFLALPDDWEYSIAGLCKISKEGRDAINTTITELKNYGYIKIERKNAEKGRFKFIYHIYEDGKAVLPSTEKPHTDKPSTDLPQTAQPQQLITNLSSTNGLSTNEQVLVKTDVFTCDELFSLYKSICVHFPQPRELTDERRKKAQKRIKRFSNVEFWKSVCEKAENSNFIKEKNWFSFDWIIKNNENPLKVYEGNYDNKKQNNNVITAFSSKSGKYSKCYDNGEPI